MIDLNDLSYSELEGFLKELGEPKFRAGQIFFVAAQGRCFV